MKDISKVHRSSYVDVSALVSLVICTINFFGYVIIVAMHAFVIRCMSRKKYVYISSVLETYTHAACTSIILKSRRYILVRFVGILRFVGR